MDRNLEQVKEFHTTFGHPVRTEPTIPTAEESALMIRLLREELDELEKAVEEGNMIEVADALGDIQILTNGAFLRCGLYGFKTKIMDEIQDSNMSKACANEWAAQKAVDESILVTDEGPLPPSLYYAPVGNVFVLYRTEDGKIMKGPDYRKPDLTKLGIC